MTTSIKLASRGSTLALTQSRMISAALEKAHRGLRVEIVEIKTSGDVKLGQSLQAIGGKGAFTKELEDALLEKRADLAVHSLKDLPTTLPEGLTVGCTPPREDVADVLLLREHQPLNELTEDPFHLLREKAVLGSSSLRRKAQALMHRADLKIIEFRGNVDTRLRKLEEGKADACLLALAGLKRLGLMDSLDKRFGVFILPPDKWLPAVSQGCLGIECRADDKRTLELLAPLHHAETFACVTAERAFLHALGAGCTAPVGAHAVVAKGQLTLKGAMFAEDGSGARRGQASGPSKDAALVGEKAAKQVQASGIGSGKQDKNKS
ncbi:MAG: hydroxymethylbilane synthase [Planctomycetes bacterium]|nr:hydroxymethylbilane synthase [Planctomycetota bacterium]